MESAPQKTGPELFADKEALKGFYDTQRSRLRLFANQHGYMTEQIESHPDVLVLRFNPVLTNRTPPEVILTTLSCSLQAEADPADISQDSSEFSFMLQYGGGPRLVLTIGK